MATSKIEVKFDFDTKDVQIATDKTLSLAQQVKLLRKELLSVPEGTQQFQLLSQKLGDTEDALAKANAKSRDLLTSFQLIPGPIGEFAAKLNGGIALLKTFSSFTLKDLQFQLKETANDFGDIFSNLGKATGITKAYTLTNEFLAKSFVRVGIGETAAAAGARAFSAALIATGIGALVVLLGTAVSALMDFADSSKEAEKATAALNREIEDQNTIIELNAKDRARQRKVDLAQMKANGASEAEIRKTNIANAKADYEENYKLLQDAVKLENEAQGKADVKGLQDAVANREKRRQAYLDSEAAYKEIGYNSRSEERKAEAAASKEAQSKRDIAAKERLQKEKQFQIDRANAIVELEKNKENTSETLLRQALEKQQTLLNDGKKISVEVAKQQAADVNRIVSEELAKDKEKRKEANDKKIEDAKAANAEIISELEQVVKESQFLYGEDSAKTRKATQDTFDARKKAIDDEVALLKAKQMTTDGLTKDEVLQLQNLGLAQRQLTLEVQTESEKQVQADRSKSQALYEAKMEAATNDFDLQQTILDAKVEQDKLFYEQQLANEKLTAEQRKAIEDAQTANKAANAETQIAIDKKKFDAQQALLQATANAINAFADIVGKNTVAGKALAVAATLINTYASIAGSLRAFSGIPVPGYAIIQAIATGLVGFKAVSDIISTPVPSGGGGGGGATPAQAAAPSTGKPRGLYRGGIISKYATGGFVSGYGSGTSDSIPALLSNGESVINASSTQMFKPLLSTINQIGGGRRFATGGIADLQSAQSTAMSSLQDALAGSQQTPMKTYVVARDMTNEQMLDREIKSRSTI